MLSEKGHRELPSVSQAQKESSIDVSLKSNIGKGVETWVWENSS